jgi:4-hydroxymandelate oxidase
MNTFDVRPEAVADYEERARQLLPTGMWARLFGDHGARGWETCTHNVDGFAAVKLAPRVLVGMSSRSLATTVLGTDVSLPVLIAPSGHHQRVHHDGELATSRAAGAAGTLMILSTAASYSIEEVAAVATGPLWSQLYFMRDRRITERLIARAEDAGYRAIVLTVDNPGVSSPERDANPAWSLTRESDFAAALEPDRMLRNFRAQDIGISDAELPTRGSFHDLWEPALTWDDLTWLRERTALPLVIKGIQSGADARRCREYGMDAIVVSNHGGFALAGARSTIETLPEVVAEAGNLEVYLDGGIRRGTDVLKAITLGARAVLIGRAQIWGLAVDGERGICDVLSILRTELDQAMAFCGIPDIRSVDQSLLASPPRW